VPEENRAIQRSEEDSQQKPAELSPEELESQNAAELPDREAMSLINANLAGADQTAPIGQGIL
jgi:hypothetical protein